MMKKTIDFLKKTLFLQPFLLCGYILLINFDEFSFSAVTWYEATLVFVTYLGFWSILFFFSRLFFKSNLKSACIATFIVFTSLMYADFFLILLVRNRYWVLMVTTGFLLLFLLLVNYKEKDIIIREKIILFFNVVLIFLNIQVLGRMVIKSFVQLTLIEEKQKIIKTNLFPQDIYLIILDGYASPKSLNKFWGFNDSNFVNSLSNMGFYFAKNPRSSYCFTMQTVSSMLNFNYIAKSDLSNEVGLLEYIKQNKLVKILNKNKYKIYNFSLFEIDENKNPYKKFSFDVLPNFYTYILNKSVFNTIISSFSHKELIDEKTFFDQNSKAINEKVGREVDIVDSLKQIINSREISPKFVFYHSITTHDPFSLDENGKKNVAFEKLSASIMDMTPWITSGKGYNSFGDAKTDSIWMDSYLSAIKYTNKVDLDLIKQILQNNQRPPTIIVMSDHGFRYLVNKPIQDVDSERYSNFCAIYYPDKNYQQLYDSITPINLIRSTLNKVISTQFKYIPDYSGLSTNTNAKE